MTGNTFRGAFGAISQQTAFGPRLFDAVNEFGPSGLRNPPRPFVLRPRNLDGRTLQPGEHFHVDVHVFDLRAPLLAHFVSAFSQFAEEGLGPGRGRAQFTAVHSLMAEGSEGDQISGKETIVPAIELSLASEPQGIREATVRFVTPTELKSGEDLVTEPEFSVLFARARDRISTLRALYGEGPLEIDFQGMAERASAVKLIRCDLDWVRSTRRSSRTGQAHPLGGFTGEAAYQGDLGEFLPFLRAAYWTGVGRQTVWGKGEITVSV